MPKHIHDCTACRYLGTFVGEFDLYICKEKSEFPSYIIRHGDDGPDYYSPYVRKEDIEALKRDLGGITDDEAIILTMFRRTFSFFLNHMTKI